MGGVEMDVNDDNIVGGDGMVRHVK